MPQQTGNIKHLYLDYFAPNASDVKGQNRRQKCFSEDVILRAETSWGNHCHAIAPNAVIVSLMNLFFFPISSPLPHQRKPTRQAYSPCSCTEVLKSLVSIKITKCEQWEYLLKPDRSNHSAPEYKSIPCWQVSGAAPLILFPHIRTARLFFGSIRDHLRQQGYTGCPASTILSQNSQSLSSYLSTTIQFFQ